MQVEQNFKMCAGEHLFSVRFTLTDSADAPLNLTGLSGSAIKFELRRHETSPILISKQEGAGISIVGLATAGVIDVTLSGGDTSELNGPYQHETRVRDSAGSLQVVASGTATINPSGLST